MVKERKCGQNTSCLIAHEGTHYFQDTVAGVNPMSRHNEYDAWAAQYAVMNNQAYHTLSKDEIQKINEDYGFSGDANKTHEVLKKLEERRYDMGDGSVHANPQTTGKIVTEFIKEYGRIPTEEEKNRIVYLAAQQMKYSDGYENHDSIISDVVKNDAYMDLAGPMANLTSVNALDVPGAGVWTDAAEQNGQATNEPTQQGNNAANQNTQQNNNATGNNTQNQPEAEQPGDNGEKPPIDTSTDGFGTKKIFKNLESIRNRHTIIVEQGSVQKKFNKPVPYWDKPTHKRFVRRAYGDKKPIYNKLKKNIGVPGFETLPFYLQQEVLNNMSDYVNYIMRTKKGSTELEKWLNRNGVVTSNFTYSDYEKKQWNM